MKQRESRLFWVDAVRATAIFLVVVIHLSAGQVVAWHSDTSLSWWVAHIFDALARPAVPLFVLLSGSLLLGKQESFTQFFKKRVSRIVLPWLWWVACTILLDYFFALNSTGFDNGMRGFVVHYFMSGFWFMPLLVQLYVLTPFLRVLVAKVSSKTLLLFGVGLIAIVSVQSTYCGVRDTCQVWPLTSGLQYLGYYLVGYAVSQLSLKKYQILLWSALWFFANLWIILGTYSVSSVRGGFSEAYYQYLSVPVAITSVALFICSKYWWEQGTFKLGIKKYIARMSAASFGIYLLHALVVKIIFATPFEQVFSPLLALPFIGIPLASVVLFGISFFIIELMQRSKYLKLGKYPLVTCS
jgi:surface polysaccharide O-acyltransferase-like enzyme